MKENERLKSVSAFNDFYKANNKKPHALSCEINAEVIYKKDKIIEKFDDQKVLLTKGSYGPSEVTLTNLDSDSFYTGFKTDFQKFELDNGKLKITGSGNGEKGYMSYCVTIIPKN